MQTRDIASPEARAALARHEAVEIIDDSGRVIAIVHVPGPLPPEPIGRVRHLLANPPTPNRGHVEKAQELSGCGLFGEYIGLLALVDAIREAVREP